MRKWMVFCLTLFLPVVAAAQPAVIPIQGTLTDPAGGPITGSHSMVLRIYSVEAGGAAIYTETQPIMVEQGVFTVYMGDVTALNLATFNGGNLWLGIQVDTDTEMSPRLRFGTVPYAAYAERGGSSIPSGAVMFFDLAACPTGWTALPQAQGRMLIGLNPGGALKACYPAGCASGALADQGARNITGSSAVPAHTHTLTNVDFNEAAFTSGGGSAHGHTASTATAGAHTHSLTRWNSGGGGTSILDWVNNANTTTTDFSTSSNGDHTHTMTVGNESSHTHSIDVPAHQHANTLASTGNTNVDVTMPYVQLLVCRKD